MATRQPKQVTVYIRRGENKERTLSFQPPPEVPQEEVLEHDYAYDGQSVVKSVPQSLPGSDKTLSERLLAEQKALMAWLGGYGYKVDFR